MRVKYLKVNNPYVDLNVFPNFSRTGSVKGMKDLYYGKNALLVRSGSYIYNVSAQPYIYYKLAY